jgi:hypothetical protein
LKFFTESELQPARQAQPGAAESGNLLTQAELEDIRLFSAGFSGGGESVLSRSGIARKPHLRAFIMLLRSLGAVRIDDTARGIRVRGAGRLARHVPVILSIYLAGSLTLLDNWNSVHMVPEDDLSAVEFLRHMELRRIELTRRSGKAPEPLADRPVAFAIFHAIDQKGRDCYLFEINKDWRRLNLIGGKQEGEDKGDFGETALREISEELGLSRDRLSITRLNGEPLRGYGLSGNAGTLASYPCVLFGVRVDGDFRSRMQDSWLTESTIIACSAMRDCPLMVNPVYLRFLLEGHPSRISRTPLSTHIRVRSADISEITQTTEKSLARWVRVLRENKDLMAAVLTLLAAVITLALALSA